MKKLNNKELRDQANSFLVHSFDKLIKNNVFLEKHWHIDHLCYRTSTDDDYILITRRFKNFSDLLIESTINGRLISTFKLKEPIVYYDWEIDLIEVPAPKNGENTANGFEHFEVVCDLTFAEIENRYKECRFDKSGMFKDLNQELRIMFDSFVLKFHQVSLESIINIEKNQSISSALMQSQVLKTLKPFNPLIVGTFPLNINVANSDLDILICSADLYWMERVLTETFSKYQNFKCIKKQVQGEPTVLVSFSCQGMDFEIFGQQIPSVKQQGYLHFLVEERLLKIGGSPLTQEVREARRQGLKTEPAFAKVLGLNGNPYQELLMLQKKSNQDLKTLIDQRN